MEIERDWSKSTLLCIFRSRATDEMKLKTAVDMVVMMLTKMWQNK